MKQLAVYCGSATPHNPAFIATAHQVGTTLAKRGIGLVYGGGRLGLMGVLADAVLAAGGEVTGVIPEALKAAETAHLGCTRLETVTTMHERKARFVDLADGFITIPGGVGTMDEYWEAVSWAQLGYHQKPVGLLNAHGFFDQLVAFMATMADSGFVRPQHRDIVMVEADIGSLLDRMAAHQPHETLLQGLI
jgi:uncharacterized protein (TIGR00730 family)